MFIVGFLEPTPKFIYSSEVKRKLPILVIISALMILSALSYTKTFSGGHYKIIHNRKLITCRV